MKYVASTVNLKKKSCGANFRQMQFLEISFCTYHLPYFKWFNIEVKRLIFQYVLFFLARFVRFLNLAKNHLTARTSRFKFGFLQTD